MGSLRVQKYPSFFSGGKYETFWIDPGSRIQEELLILTCLLILNDILLLGDYTREPWEYSVIQTIET